VRGALPIARCVAPCCVLSRCGGLVIQG
jgi:hypothetical protein